MNQKFNIEFKSVLGESHTLETDDMNVAHQAMMTAIEHLKIHNMKAGDLHFKLIIDTPKLKCTQVAMIFEPNVMRAFFLHYN